MKKIIIEKEEGIAEVVDRMLEVAEDEVALVIPKGSTLGRSVKNFHLLKREADAAGKTVVIESVDDSILAFAKESDIDASHPLWRGVQGGGVSDIVPADGSESERSSSRKKKAGNGKKQEVVKLEVPNDEEEEEMEPPAIIHEVEEAEEKEDRFLGAAQMLRDKVKDRIPSWAKPERKSESEEEEMDEDDEEEVALSRYGRRGSKLLMWSGIGVIAIIAIVFSILTWSFDHASVSINFKKTPWEYKAAFTADKAVSKTSATVNTIPAQVFSTQKNTTQQFKATGNANVSIKSQGTITVYNAYNSSPQQLVATTRFVTPDGKIFRLVNNITVPGAKIADGKIVPSSIDAAVIADQAGPSYNVGPVAKLSIPGFQGSPKFTTFYGELKSGTTGGFTGSRAVPTSADIASAKDTVSETLKTNLASTLTTSYPNNFKILDGATSVVVTKLTVSTTTDASGNFNVYGEASLQAIGFDEAAFKALLLQRAQSQVADSIFKTIAIDYSGTKADLGKGIVSFSVDAQGTLEPAFSADDFKGTIAGKSIGEARLAIAGIQGLSDGKISVWPMWLWRLPANPDKVRISVD